MAEEEAKSTGKKVDPKKAHSARKPDADTVFDFHANSDVDAHNGALHHTLGTANGQASPGTHNHDAASPDGVPLWSGITLNDPVPAASNAELAAAITALNALIRQKSA